MNSAMNSDLDKKKINANLKIGLDIKTKLLNDSFEIICSECGSPTANEYLGYDPDTPHFRAVCCKCGKSGDWKLKMWDGLSVTPRR
jgi:hypothetical protein